MISPRKFINREPRRNYPIIIIITNREKEKKDSVIATQVVTLFGEIGLRILGSHMNTV